ncbi:hypothetical protein AK830_g4268 [Neonectria ditissima]|uniref:PD-(D/E)XK nuclease-like domain-containing protein n=1 Tax=Neonectria ditissima TaxID=78410 RepID=A0A0N8H7N5_9HYPO|nr:hypothetical protein AK830_g4268 [Neonectria ditissima]
MLHEQEWGLGSDDGFEVEDSQDSFNDHISLSSPSECLKDDEYHVEGPGDENADPETRLAVVQQYLRQTEGTPTATPSITNGSPSAISIDTPSPVVRTQGTALYPDLSRFTRVTLYTSSPYTGVPFVKPAPSRPRRISVRDLIQPLTIWSRKELDFGTSLPESARSLYNALVRVESKQGILPIVLCRNPEFQGPEVQSFMWRTPSLSVAATHIPNGGDQDEMRIMHEHAKFVTILRSSINASYMEHNEGQWNSNVHSPFLYQCVGRARHVSYDRITSNEFQLPFGERRPEGPARGNTLGERSETQGANFALMLQADDAELQAAVQLFVQSPNILYASAGSELYNPLREPPGPIIIVTKTNTASKKEALDDIGKRAVAWHSHIQTIAAINRMAANVISIPAIYVIDGVWNVVFLQNKDDRVHIFDRDFRIGDTNTILGIYQLQTALQKLTTWMAMEFKPYMIDFLKRAASSRHDYRTHFKSPRLSLI